MHFIVTLEPELKGTAVPGRASASLVGTQSVAGSGRDVHTANRGQCVSRSFTLAKTLIDYRGSLVDSLSIPGCI